MSDYIEVNEREHFEESERLRNERDALLRALEDARAAIEHIGKFQDALEAQPLGRLNAVELYGIHGGDDDKPHGASLHWADIEAIARLRSALPSAGENLKEERCE